MKHNKKLLVAAAIGMMTVGVVGCSAEPDVVVPFGEYSCLVPETTASNLMLCAGMDYKQFVKESDVMMSSDITVVSYIPDEATKLELLHSDDSAHKTWCDDHPYRKGSTCEVRVSKDAAVNDAKKHAILKSNVVEVTYHLSK